MTLSITAIVPNFDYAQFLPARLASIREQSRAPDALLFLDDASADDSLAVARAALEGWTVPVQWRVQPRNTGSVLRQWELGARTAGTDAVWIAEADDAARPGLLAALAARLEEDEEALFAFADSATIDARGEVIAASSKEYTTAFDPALAVNQSLPAAEFVRRCLTPRNAMVNASAVLWRTAVLRGAFDRLGREAERWRCAGDWRLYIEACSAGGVVHYVAEPLNLHRHHGTSVTSATPRPAHFAEVVALLLRLRRWLGPDAARDAAMARHLRELSAAWSIGGAA